MSHDPMRLPIATAAVVTIAALMTDGDFATLAATARELVDAGARPADLREAAYVASLFCGFPKAVSALVALSDLDPAGCHHEPPPSRRGATRARGEALFRAIHRRHAGRQLAMLESVHPPLADTILTEAYGRVLSRELLPLATRELIGAASLAVQGLTPQLRAHLLGAHNCGAGWDVIEAAIRLALEQTGAKPDPALAQLAELRRRVP